MADDLQQYLDEPNLPDWVTETESADKERAEGRLIPTGTFEGTLTAYAPKDRAPERGLYTGKTLIHLTTELYGVEGKTRPYWFDVSAEKVLMADGRLAKPSYLWGKLVAVTHTDGKTKRETLEAAKQLRLRFKIRRREADDSFPARNETETILLSGS